MRLLVAEDEQDLNNVISNKLKSVGYSVDSCLNGEDALAYATVSKYDAILLDVMMPKMDGWEVLKSMRERGNATPILFLTARDSVDDRVKGLDMGANDYLVKPFAFDELLARIRVLTRTGAGAASSVYTVGDLKVDGVTRVVRRGGKVIELSPKEFALLEHLAANRGKVLSRDNIAEHIYNMDYEGGSNVIDVYIRFLRKKIDDPYEKKLIHTVRGAGYVLKEE